MSAVVTVIGGGLAGCEAAWQAAQRGQDVLLYEMRPARATGAHQSGWLAELVCSNSLGSALPDRATGLLQAELAQGGSLLMASALAARVPAGGALAVDREAFARRVSEAIAGQPRIRVVREEVATLPDPPTVIATGPLTAPGLAAALAALTGREHLFFYDAIAPIVALESVNLAVAFRSSRYGRGGQDEGDYLNCPFTREEYERFVAALVAAERIPLSPLDQPAAGERFFEGCLPVEVLASRGRDTLAFGPMRPVGLVDPRTGRRPWAVVQLRQDNLAGTLYNLVGFQTNLRYPEQDRVFRMIPGLEQAEFVRHGQMHRNTFLAAPALLDPTLELRGRPGLFVAGQLAGVEGYCGSMAAGWLAGVNAARRAAGRDPLTAPPTLMMGALFHYLAHADIAHFQPMKANLGLLPPLPAAIRDKRARAAALVARAKADSDGFFQAARGG